jgi:cobalt-zinc-cadmium efflux system outer membrane protein
MVHKYRLALGRRVLRLLLISGYPFAVPSVARAEPPANVELGLSAPFDRETLVRLVVARNPSVLGAGQRARATDVAADAEGRLPPPQVMGQIWQAPLSRPYAVGDSQMIMIGVSQAFPAPGSSDAREAARHQDARVEEAVAAERARQVAREAEHAFADYVEAAGGHRIHSAHQDVARRVLAVAQGRQAAGGALTEVAQAEVELARVQADLMTDAARMDTARAKINALLGRDPSSPLGLPVEGEPRVSAWTRDRTLATARSSRPELRAANARQEAKKFELRAAEREATWPSFSLGVSYFAPTTFAPFNGYGLNAALALPWLWSGEGLRRDAQKQYLAAARTEIEGVRIQIDAEVVTAESNARAAAQRLQVEQERVLPATRRAFDLAWGGYESGRTDLVTLLAARRSVVDAEHDVVMSRAALDHALADLDAAVGVPVPRRPLAPLGADGEEANHG